MKENAGNVITKCEPKHTIFLEFSFIKYMWSVSYHHPTIHMAFLENARLPTLRAWLYSIHTFCFQSGLLVWFTNRFIYIMSIKDKNIWNLQNLLQNYKCSAMVQMIIRDMIWYDINELIRRNLVWHLKSYLKSYRLLSFTKVVLSFFN